MKLAGDGYQQNGDRHELWNPRTLKLPLNLLHPAEEMANRRTDHRRRVLKGANLYFNKGYGAFDCTVKNISSGGALVEMEDSSGLPSMFDFNIKGESENRTATISWRKNGRAGIRFL